MKKILLLLLLGCGTFALSAQTVVGTWKTVDDETGQTKGQVQIYEQGGQFFGKVVKMFTRPADQRCENCPGDRKDQPVMHMVILENMQLKSGYWQGGRILDPEKGKWYTCKLWLKEGDPNVLVVRGYIGPFYRTQYWYRVP